MRITNTDFKIGYQGESYSRNIEYIIDDRFKECDIHIEFEKPNGKKYTTKKIENIESGLYSIPYELLTDVGNLQVQIIARKPNTDYIIKSLIKTFYIMQSINAVDELIESENSWNIVDDIYLRATELQYDEHTGIINLLGKDKNGNQITLSSIDLPTEHTLLKKEDYILEYLNVKKSSGGFNYLLTCYGEDTEFVVNYERKYKNERNKNSIIPLNNPLGGRYFPHIGKPQDGVIIFDAYSLIICIFGSLIAEQIRDLGWVIIDNKIECDISPEKMYEIAKYNKIMLKEKTRGKIRSFFNCVREYIYNGGDLTYKENVDYVYSAPIKIFIKPVKNIKQIFNEDNELVHITYITGTHGIEVNFQLKYNFLEEIFTIEIIEITKIKISE